MKPLLQATALFLATTTLTNAQAQSGVYQVNTHTLFYLPLDSPDAGAPEGCRINNPALLSYIPDRFGTSGKAIHVSARGSASDFFFIECHNAKIASSAPVGFTVGYWIRTSVQQLGDCSFTGICSMRNLTILASNSDNGGCRKYLTAEIDGPNPGPNSVGAFPIACASASDPPLKSTISISDGQWHNLIWVFDYANRLQTLYLDGVQNNQASLAATLLSAADFQAVAGAENGSFALNGDMDDLWMEDHAWSPCEVDSFFAATRHICLEFPVPNHSLCGGPCTPRTAPIAAIFDHWMVNSYECTPSQNSGSGKIMDFRGEAAGGRTNRSSDHGVGFCHQLFGYTNDGQEFLTGVANYVGVPSESGNQALQYYSHPGYDYSFPFKTPIYAAISGCVSYAISAPGEPATKFHVLTIIPSDSEPVGGCANATSATGYRVYYLHLSSFFSAEDGKVERSLTDDGSEIVACSSSDGCAQPDMWVPVNTPIGYSGNFASGWYNSPDCIKGVRHICGVPAHLHFEVDLERGGQQKPVDPYGWHPIDPSEADQYTIFNPDFQNITLWNRFRP